MNTQTNFADEFTITLRDQCRDVAIVAGSQIALRDSLNMPHGQLNPFTVYLWQLLQANFAPIQLPATPTACPVTYYVSDTDYDRTQIDPSIVKIDTSNPAQYQV